MTAAVDPNKTVATSVLLQIVIHAKFNGFSTSFLESLKRLPKNQPIFQTNENYTNF